MPAFNKWSFWTTLSVFSHKWEAVVSRGIWTMLPWWAVEFSQAGPQNLAKFSAGKLWALVMNAAARFIICTRKFDCALLMHMVEHQRSHKIHCHLLMHIRNGTWLLVICKNCASQFLHFKDSVTCILLLVMTILILHMLCMSVMVNGCCTCIRGCLFAWMKTYQRLPNNNALVLIHVYSLTYFSLIEWSWILRFAGSYTITASLEVPPCNNLLYVVCG